MLEVIKLLLYGNHDNHSIIKCFFLPIIYFLRPQMCVCVCVEEIYGVPPSCLHIKILIVHIFVQRKVTTQYSSMLSKKSHLICEDSVGVEVFSF